MRNVFVMHTFCESAHAEIGSKSVDISLTDLDREIMEIEVNTRDNVLRLAQIKYLFLPNNSFSISRNDYLFSTLLMIYYMIWLSYTLKILGNLSKFFSSNLKEYMFECLYNKKNLLLFFKKV